MTTTHDGAPRPEESENESWPNSEWANAAMVYLVRLKAYLGKQENTGTSISIPVAGNRFLVSPIERELILGIDDPQAARVSESDELIRHSIGMQVKLMDDVAHFEQIDESKRIIALSRLNAGIEYGELCAYEMHRSVSSLSRDGDLEGGKQMAEYRRRLVRLLEKSGRVAGAKDNAPIVQEITRPSYDPKAAARAKAKALNKTKKKKGELSVHLKKLYLATSIILFLATAVILFQLWSDRERALESIRVEDLRSIPGVEQVLCRAPGIIVIVSDASWDGTSATAKRKAIDDLVAAVAPMGYRRAEIRSPTRQGLAVWHRGKEPTIR